MPLKRIDQARPFLILLIAFAAWLVLPALFKRFARLSFFEFQAPVEVTAGRVRDLQNYWSLRTRAKNDLIEAGQQLSRLNASYELSIRKNAALEAEVARLEELLRLPSFDGYRGEPARVLRRDFNAWWQRLVIRKGSMHGITAGSPVIFVGGVVGRVTEVGAYTAVVDLVSNPGLRLAACIEGDDRPVSYQGAGARSLARAEEGRVEFVPLDILAGVTDPRRLVTSGQGGIFPPGLSIGLITRLEAGSDGLFKSGPVLLDPRLASVSEVTVLVPLTPSS
ncbi:MAG: rod shape-determining protein MreC [Opitutaceae bacterium]|nr:rod shape-determining protein MreC [Opitutaceae bacterium]